MRPHLKIGALAEGLTPGQLGELLSLAQTTLALGGPSFISATARRDPDVGPLVDRRLVTWGPAASMGRGHRAYGLTLLGQQVLLQRVSFDLHRLRAITAPVLSEPD